MQALVLNQVKAPLRLEERASPVPGPGEALVTLQAASLNRRDFWITQGLYPSIRTPVILGSDGAGRVAAVGSEDTDGAWVGREVVMDPGMGWGPRSDAQSAQFHILGMPRDGTFAEQVVVPVAQLRDKPSHLSWSEAAALPLAAVTAFRAVFTQGGLREGENLLISGIGGGVATFALQFAVAAGAKVWVTSSSLEKIERAVSLGAQGGFAYTEPDWTERCRRAVGAFDLIVDSAGGRGYAGLIGLAGFGGRIVNYGATAGSPEKMPLAQVFWKQLRLIGSTMGAPSDFDGMLSMVQSRGLRPIIDAVVPLSDGAAAVERMKEAPQFGKTVLQIDA